MEILFLISLLLAWPTNGLSIVFFLSILFGKIYLKKRSNQFFLKKKRAQEKLLTVSTGYPSWIYDKDTAEVFSSVVNSLLSHSKVPDYFTKEIFQNKESATSILYYAHNLEREGASFTEQQSATADFIFELWQKRLQELTTVQHSKSPQPTVYKTPTIETTVRENSVVNKNLNTNAFKFTRQPELIIPKTSNKKSYDNFYYLIENKKIKITKKVESLRIDKDLYHIDYLDPKKYPDRALAKISVLLLNTDKKDHPGKPDMIRISFFKIDKNTDKKIIILFLLYKKMRGDLFFNFMKKISSDKNNSLYAIGDDIKLSDLLKARL